MFGYLEVSDVEYNGRVQELDGFGKLYKGFGINIELQECRDKLTRWVIYLKHASEIACMNAVSSSCSVYHGPPLTSAEGWRSYSMYIFLVGY